MGVEREELMCGCGEGGAHVWVRRGRSSVWVWRGRSSCVGVKEREEPVCGCGEDEARVWACMKGRSQ